MTHRIRVALLIGVTVPLAFLVTSRFVGVRDRSGHGKTLRAAALQVPGNSTGCADRSGPSKASCYRLLLYRRLATTGVESTLVTLQALTTVDADVARDAHVYAHGIGIDAFELRPDVGATFSQCTPGFSSGCYHGVMQAYFERRGAADSVTVNDACRSYEQNGANRWLLFQCLHGMGHGLDMMLDHDLLRALHACDFLDDSWHQESCYGGVFMENIMHVIEPHHPATLLAAQGHAAIHMQGEMSGVRGIKRADPLYPCSVTAARYGRACYMIQTAAILHFNGGDIADAARTCGRAQSRFQATCYQSLGRDVSAYARGSAQTAVTLCNLGAPALKRWCYVGAAKSFVDQGAMPGPGFAVCRDVPAAVDKAPCYYAVGEQIAALAAEPGSRAALCASAGTTYLDDCLNGARVPRQSGQLATIP